MKSRKAPRGFVLLPLVLVFFSHLFLSGETQAEERLVLFDGSVARWRDASAEVEALGGRVVQGFPPGGAVLDGENAFWEAVSRAEPSWRVEAGPIGEKTIGSLGREARFAALGWNRRFAPRGPAPVSPLPPMLDDAAPGPKGDPGPGKKPPGANFYDTSEFLLGSVAIVLLLPESNGLIDPSTENWTAAEVDSVAAQIVQGLPFWIDHAPGGGLSFVYRFVDPVPCPYEAISRPAFSAKQESLWVRAVFDTLGYDTGDAFYRARSYLNDLRDSLGTDWAVAIFVADSKNDADGKFFNDYYGFSYYGGPYLAMTYDNATHGIANMHAVAPHELAHSFYALDEYYAAHKPCLLAMGYEFVQNQNSQYGSCQLNESCIMRDHLEGAFDSSRACSYTRGQTGMRDTDGDGIPNVLDTYPTTLLDPFPDSTADVSPTFNGTAHDNPLLNRNTLGQGNEITLNTITRVEYRVDSGDWADADPSDGAFDSLYEAYTFTTLPLAETAHTVEVRATSSSGNADTVFASESFVVFDNLPPGPPAPVAAAPSDSEVVLTWTNAADPDIGSVMIRFATTGFPADTAAGTLLALRPASPLAPDTVLHAGLLPDTTYYYSLFTLDEVPNASAPATVSATPLYPLPPAALLSPVDGSLHAPPAPTFVWSAISLPPENVLAAYGIQAARDSLFTDLWIDVEATTGAPADTFWTSTPLPDGTIFWWRVRGKETPSETYGLWSAPSRFATDLSVQGIAFLDSTLSAYTNFADGDSLEPNASAAVEVKVLPADTLDIGEFRVFVHWGGAAPDSAPLVLDRNEGGAGYWRGEIPFGTAFSRGDTVSFFVSAASPGHARIIDDNSGALHGFIAGRNPVPAWHVPRTEEPIYSMRNPFVPLDTDTLVIFTLGGTPAGGIAGGEVFFRFSPSGSWGVLPLALDTLIDDIAYWTATLDTTFLLTDWVEYYFRIVGSASYDTTYVYGGNDASFTATVLGSALTSPFSFVVQSATGVQEGGSPATPPARNALLANRPNPFNPTTAIPFALAEPSHVNVTVYDAAGRTVRVVLDGSYPAGWHVAAWDGRSDARTEAPSGVYFAVIRAGGWHEGQKLLLLR